jgi:hypothetical protein
MKKIGPIFLALFLIVGAVSIFAQDRLSVDLSTLPLTKNATPFVKNYDDLLITFPEWPSSINWSNFNRIIVKAKYFNADGSERRQADTEAMVSLIYDLNGDIRGPDMGPGPNTPLKQFNVGGSSGSVHRDTGSAVRLTKAPQAILLQNSNVNVKFIEVTEITFFKR